MRQEQVAEVEAVEQEETPAPRQLPPSLSQEEYEALSQHNAERHDWIAAQGQQHREVTSKGYQRQAD